MDSSERERGVSVLVHTALLASVGIYAVLLVFLQGEISGGAPARVTGTGVFLAFAGVGVVQFAGATAFARALIRSRRGTPSDRVRRSFLLRGAAAEAIALYGFALGFLGAPRLQALALMAMGAAALVSCFPTRPAWDVALQAAQGPPR